VFTKERIDIVHGHSAFSTLAHEALFVGSLLGLATVFTDHSLFGFADVSAIVTNTFLKYSLANTDHCICVSHTGKENTVLRLVKHEQFSTAASFPFNCRSSVQKHCVSVIPNAVDSDSFTPDLDREDLRDGRVVVVIGSRLVYRKGVDLVVSVIPRICGRRFGPFRVDFLIGGDGPKRILFEEMIEENGLQSRVTMLGELAHSDMRNKLLTKGDIFLNASLTEAFCMAIVEAVSCGLTVVSTRVGGIPEVLPERYIYFVEPDISSLEDGLCSAVRDVIAKKRPSKSECHAFTKEAYNWHNVAERTELVYSGIVSDRAPAKSTLARKVRNLWERGRVAGPMMAVLFLFCHYWILILDRLSPV
jgi:phosphatidylinositol glycan class A protein